MIGRTYTCVSIHHSLLKINISAPPPALLSVLLFGTLTSYSTWMKLPKNLLIGLCLPTTCKMRISSILHMPSRPLFRIWFLQVFACLWTKISFWCALHCIFSHFRFFFCSFLLLTRPLPARPFSPIRHPRTSNENTPWLRCSWHYSVAGEYFFHLNNQVWLKSARHTKLNLSCHGYRHFILPRVKLQWVLFLTRELLIRYARVVCACPPIISWSF